MANLLDKTRKITSILQRSVDSLEGDLPYNNMAAQLADIIDCNAAIVNGGGALLGFAMKYKTNNDRVEKFFKAKQLPEEYIRGISRVYDTQENIGIDSDLTIFPVELKDDFPDGLTQLHQSMVVVCVLVLSLFGVTTMILWTTTLSWLRLHLQ